MKTKKKITELIDPAKPYPEGENSKRDARYTAFFIENHLDYYAYPDHVASPEQIGFMAWLEDGQRFYPCTDRMFGAIMNLDQPEFLESSYKKVLDRIIELINSHIKDKNEKNYLKALARIKYKHETRDTLMLPSRLEKRLLKIFLHRTHIGDPFAEGKNRKNICAYNILNSHSCQKALSHVDDSDFIRKPETIYEYREALEYIELRRLLTLSVENALWESEDYSRFASGDYSKIFSKKITGNGVDPFYTFLGVKDKPIKGFERKKIMWVANEAGEIMIDLYIIKFLVKLGHKVIISLKAGPLFDNVIFEDAVEDSVLKDELKNAAFIEESDLTKNELISILRRDVSIFIISDGTSEKLNLLLASTTFARVFKEVDAVISKGPEKKSRFFDTHFQFTQDVYNISKKDNECVEICFKPRHESIIKFSHIDLEKKALKIIKKMEDAKKQGMTVVFYSGIIGSIPDKIDVAKKIMSVFIQHLSFQSTMTFIINPSEYFEPGMDADDLMYMWEIVQRSGLINIWRFQTYEDISKAFSIMNQKVPPEWVGKDATYSTGCTKEMGIAIQVQKEHAEMQMIGPSREKFMRRKDYGVGKMYDKRLS